MSYTAPAHTAARRLRSSILALAVVITAVLLGELAYQSFTSSSSSATAPIEPLAHLPHSKSHTDHGGGLGIAGGAVPDGTTVFDGDVPAVARLDPDLLSALRKAARYAAPDGVAFEVSSGWRSPAYQEKLLREAVSKYGSEAEAARWVATPKTSAHVSGDAVDIGSSKAAAWLSARGAAYGLCQIYSNEAWHYELRPAAINDGCPAKYADPSQDPRMQK